MVDIKFIQLAASTVFLLALIVFLKFVQKYVYHDKDAGKEEER